jgi:hypothetical protein
MKYSMMAITGSLSITLPVGNQKNANAYFKFKIGLPNKSIFGMFSND